MPNPRNPYTPPTAHVADRVERPDADAAETFIPNGRTVPGGQGAAWIGDAWRLFRAQPGKWLLVLLLVILFYIVVSVAPLSSVTTVFVWPFISAGIVMAADQQRRTGTFELGELFVGFRKQPASLLVVGVLGVLSTVVLFLSLAIMVGMDAAMQTALGIGEAPDPFQMLSLNYLLALLVYLAFAIPISAATYLAPPLILLHGLPPGSSLKMSFVGLLKNILSGLVYSLCALGLFIVAAIPLGLGLFIWAPVMMITTYTVYRDIFIETRRR